jgi:hypothetical protein
VKYKLFKGNTDKVVKIMVGLGDYLCCAIFRPNAIYDIGDVGDVDVDGFDIGGENGGGGGGGGREISKISTTFENPPLSPPPKNILF